MKRKWCVNCRQHPPAAGDGTDDLCILCWTEREIVDPGGPNDRRAGPRWQYPYEHKDHAAEMRTILSAKRDYRFTLWRDWFEDLFDHGAYAAPTPNYVQFIGLNPSKADETTDDATIRVLRSFTKSFGYSRFVMTNLFSYRATDPKEMMKARDPIGYMNDPWLFALAKNAVMVVACWSAHGTFKGRGAQVTKRMQDEGIDLKCFGVTANGQPRHPLRLSLKTTLIDYGS